MRDGVAVIGEVLLKSRFKIFVQVLAFNKQQWQAINKTDDVCAPPVKITTPL